MLFWNSWQNVFLKSLYFGLWKLQISMNSAYNLFFTKKIVVNRLFFLPIAIITTVSILLEKCKTIITIQVCFLIKKLQVKNFRAFLKMNLFFRAQKKGGVCLYIFFTFHCVSTTLNEDSPLSQLLLWQDQTILLFCASVEDLS